MEKIIIPGQDERLGVLIALAQNAPKTVSECPSDEEFAAFMDNRLTPEDRMRILEHIDGCSECYHHWMDISLLKEEDSGESRRKIYQWSIPAFAFALAASLILILLPPNPGKMIEKSYSSTVVSTMTFKTENAEKVFAMPWESRDLSYGFSDSGRKAPRYQAFGDGLKRGRQILKADKDDVSIKDWADTNLKTYFQMGQWLFLLRAACLSDTAFAEDFWKDQYRISEKITKSFAEAPEKTEDDERLLNRGAEIIRSVSEKQAVPDKQGCRKIAAAADSLIGHFSPGQ